MRIRELRENAGLSQKQLAERLGVDQSAVCLWENGKTFPTTKRLLDLSKLFNVPVDALFDK
jgi:transcriptional regulator with XRE-family HTH domain